MRAASARPKALASLRIVSYGGRSPCSSSSRLGIISASMNRRTMSWIIKCCSLHSIIVGLLTVGLAERLARKPAEGKRRAWQTRLLEDRGERKRGEMGAGRLADREP